MVKHRLAKFKFHPKVHTYISICIPIARRVSYVAGGMWHGTQRDWWHALNGRKKCGAQLQQVLFYTLFVVFAFCFFLYCCLIKLTLLGAQ